MATATPPIPDDRSNKRQKGDDAGNSSQGAVNDNSFASRQPPQHPSQMYPPGGPPYMSMGGGPPYMGQAGMPPYGQYGNPHGPPPPVYGGMYGGGPPVRGHSSPERPGRPNKPPPGAGPWNGYRGGPPPPGAGGPPGMGKKDDKDNGNGPQQQPTPNHPYPPGGWGHPQWQPGHPPYGPPPPGYPGGHPSMPAAGMYNQGAGGGGWNASGPGPTNMPGDVNNTRAPPSGTKSPVRSQPRPDSTTPNSRQPPQLGPPRPGDNPMYCVDVGSIPGGPGGRTSVTQDLGEDGSSVSGSTKEKGRGSYKCGRCGVPKKGHICPYQPKLKRRPDEPPPETRNAAVQVEMDEFMTLRRLNIRIQGFPESYATEPFMGASMVGAEPHYAASEPFVGADPMQQQQQPPPPPVDDIQENNGPPSDLPKQDVADANIEGDLTSKEEKTEMVGVE